ncbi:MAG: phage tail protein [Alphaproteobacteria bacterium]
MAKLLPIVVNAAIGFVIGGPPGAIAGAVSGAFQIAAASLAPKPKAPEFIDRSRELSVIARSSIEPRRIVYGEARVSGPLAFADTTAADNAQLHLVIPLAGHRVEAIGDVYLNDSIAWLRPDGVAMYRRHATNDGGGDAEHGIGLYSIHRHLGDDDQAADAALIVADPKWTSEHRLRGIAYLYVRLKADHSTWASGIPNLAAVVRGRQLYDPRAAAVPIAASSAGAPSLFATGAAHGLSPGDRVFVAGHEGAAPAVEKEYQVATTPSATSFTLLDKDGETLGLSTGGAGGALTRMAWSDNAALCVLDYLLAEFGFNCDLDEIDAASFVAAANLCDEMVALSETTDGFAADPASDVCTRAALSVPMRRGDAVQVSSTGALPGGLSAGVTYYYIPESPVVAATGETAGQPEAFRFRLASSRANALAGTGIGLSSAGSGEHTITRKAQVRYDCNGVVSLDQPPIEVMREILSSMAGVLTYSQGTFKLFAAAAGAPTAMLDEDDLRGELGLRTRLERKALFNTVRGTFVDPDNAWQPTDFPPFANAGFKAADGAEEIARDIELPFTNDATRAQRLAKITLMRARTGGLTINFPAKLTALRIAPWDTVAVSLAKLGWADQRFLVGDWRFSDDLGIDLSLSAVAASDYAWDAAEARAPNPPPALTPLDVTFVQAPGLALADDVVEASPGEIVSRLVATLNAPADQFITGFEAEFRKAGDALWTQMGAGGRTRFYAVGVEDGASYEVRARAINAAGAFSDYAAGSRQIVGATAPPADVSGFAVNIIGGTAHLSWNPVGDADLSHYRVRWSPDAGGASWANAVDLVPRVGRPATSVHLPALTGSYLIKAVDLGGRESLNAALSVSGIAAVLGFNAVETVQEDPAFAGTHAGTVRRPDGVLILDGAIGWDDLDGDWDELAGDWDAFGGALPGGTYTFHDGVDLGAVYTSRVSAVIAVETINYSSTWDELSGGFGQLDGTWDSLTPARNVGASLEIRTTEDDPAGSPGWSPWRPFVVGDYTARAYQFRAQLTSAAADASPGVGALRVTVDMPDRVAAGSGASSAAAPVGIAFAPAFKVAPRIGVTVKDMASGDYVAITGESAAGFALSVFNGAGSRVVRNFDWMAKGYGE